MNTEATVEQPKTVLVVGDGVEGLKAKLDALEKQLPADAPRLNAAEMVEKAKAELEREMVKAAKLTSLGRKQFRGATPAKAPLMATLKEPFAVEMPCGHRYDPREMPRFNCNLCWNTYFSRHAGTVAGWKSVIETLGVKAVEAQEGTKLVKQLQRFLKERHQ